MGEAMTDYSLHKQLYELSGLWGDNLDAAYERHPKYTTDYLLEVLPKKLGSVIAELSIISEVDDDGNVTHWYANYDLYSLRGRWKRKQTGESITAITKALTPYPHGKTPLESLLKLAIELIQDGVWSPKDE